jgi:heme/copper-type cytochrome/quinol oxidase subunit 2
MRSTGARIALAVAAIAAVVILFIVLSGDDDDSNSGGTTATSTATQTQTQTQTQTTGAQEPEVVVVKDGKPQGGIKELEYSKGDRIRLVVRSDVADEIHIHGYDLKQDVPAGGSARFSFTADIEGVFEIELEERGEQIAELRVSPS